MDKHGIFRYVSCMTTPTKPKKRDVHLHLEPEHDQKLQQISAKLWSDQKRTGKPTDIAGVCHAIGIAHEIMFAK